MATQAHLQPNRVCSSKEQKGGGWLVVVLGFPMSSISRRRLHVSAAAPPDCLLHCAVVPAYAGVYSSEVEKATCSWWGAPFWSRRAAAPWGTLTHVRMRPGLRFAAAVAFQRAGSRACGAGAVDPSASMPGLEMGATSRRAAWCRPCPTPTSRAHLSAVRSATRP